MILFFFLRLDLSDELEDDLKKYGSVEHAITPRYSLITVYFETLFFVTCLMFVKGKQKKFCIIKSPFLSLIYLQKL